MLTNEHFFQCPYCGETISFILEVATGTTEYIEDCEVCCNPIEIKLHMDMNGSLDTFEAQSIEQ